jgi:hypothetical protein
MRKPIRLILPLLAFCAAAAGAQTPAPATPLIQVEASLVTGTTGGLYIPGRFTAASVRIRNSADPVEAEIVLYPKGRHGAAYRRAVFLSKGEKRFEIPFLPAPTSWSWSVAVLERETGRRLAAAPDLTLNSTMNRLVLTCPGNVGLHEAADAFPPNRRCNIVQIAPRSFPDRYLAYDSVDVLVLTPANYDRLSPAQWEAVRDWTWLGGHLLVLTGSSPDRFTSPALRELLPVRLAGTTRIGTLQALSARLQVPVGPAPLEVTAAELKPGVGRAWVTEQTDGGRAVCTIAERPWGYGRCTWVGLRLDAPPFAGPEALARTRLWNRLMNGPEPADETFMDGVKPHHEPAAGRREALARELTPRAGRPLSAWTVLVFALGYGVLVGPVAYHVLRRRRNIGAGVAFGAAAVLAFALLAWLLSVRSKSAAYLMHEVAVEDVCLENGWTRTVGLASVFLPDAGRSTVRVEGPRAWLGARGAPQLQGAAGTFISSVAQSGTDPTYDFRARLWSTRSVAFQAQTPLPPHAGLDALTRLQWFVEEHPDLFARTWLIRPGSVHALGRLRRADLEPDAEGRLRLGPGTTLWSPETLTHALPKTWNEWPFTDERRILALSLARVEQSDFFDPRPGLPRLSLWPVLGRPDGAVLVGAATHPPGATLERAGTLSRRIRTVRIPLPPDVVRLLDVH